MLLFQCRINKSIIFNNMKTLIVCVILSYAVCVSNVQVVDPQEVRCLVCKTSLEELDKAVNKIDPIKKVNVGGYRLDPEGNFAQKSVSQAKSEIHLSEVIEEICKEMDNYAKATWKSNGTLTLLRMEVDGKANIHITDVDFVHDGDLNLSLKYNCEGILGEYEERIIELYKLDTRDIINKICVEESEICRDNRKSYVKKTDEL